MAGIEIEVRGGVRVAHMRSRGANTAMNQELLDGVAAVLYDDEPRPTALTGGGRSGSQGCIYALIH